MFYNVSHIKKCSDNLYSLGSNHIQERAPLVLKNIKSVGVRQQYTMEYYTAIKRNKTGSFVEKWMD